MKMVDPFDVYHMEYDKWYDKNRDIYYIELKAIKNLLPSSFQSGLEIGVGTGRFASMLNIKIGIDPSLNMLWHARKRKIIPVCGIAEQLPFKKNSFDLIIMITTICFLNDISLAFEETNMALKENGYVILGFINKESDIAKEYFREKHKSKFYKTAKFYGCNEVISYLESTNFEIKEIKQCLLPDKPLNIISDGCNKGGFVAIKAKKIV